MEEYQLDVVAENYLSENFGEFIEDLIIYSKKLKNGKIYWFQTKTFIESKKAADICMITPVYINNQGVIEILSTYRDIDYHIKEINNR